jgi:hypothetical protein
MLRMFLNQNFAMVVSEYKTKWCLTLKFKFLSAQVTGSDLDRLTYNFLTNGKEKQKAYSFSF